MALNMEGAALTLALCNVCVYVCVCVCVCVQVVAESGCRLWVSGLQPNQDYVFAVAAYGSTGVVLGGGIGQTSGPFLAAHSLSLTTAWGYCSQVMELVLS